MCEFSACTPVLEGPVLACRTYALADLNVYRPDFPFLVCEPCLELTVPEFIILFFIYIFIINIILHIYKRSSLAPGSPDREKHMRRRFHFTLIGFLRTSHPCAYPDRSTGPDGYSAYFRDRIQDIGFRVRPGLFEVRIKTKTSYQGKGFIYPDLFLAYRMRDEQGFQDVLYFFI